MRDRPRSQAGDEVVADTAGDGVGATATVDDVTTFTAVQGVTTAEGGAPDHVAAVATG